MGKKRPKAGVFSFTCCEGCQFTILFLDNLMHLFECLDFQAFHLLGQRKRGTKYDIAFIEGAITTKREVQKLKRIRKAADYVVAIGACAIHGGVPSMRNFIENKNLEKYVFNQKMLQDSIDVEPIDKFIKVDHYLRGCPIIKDEFIAFVEGFCNDKRVQEFRGSVCDECPRRGKDCLLLKKEICLGAVTRGGCKALCPPKNIPCILCRGPIDKANFPAEISLFKQWGLSEKDIYNKLRKFKDIKFENVKTERVKS